MDLFEHFHFPADIVVVRYATEHFPVVVKPQTPEVSSTGKYVRLVNVERPPQTEARLSIR